MAFLMRLAYALFGALLCTFILTKTLRILSNRMGNMDDRMEKIETKLGL